MKVPEEAPDPDSSKSNGPLSVSSRQAREPGRYRRHLEGWPLAVLAVSIALFGAALALPRPQPPEELPVPVVDRREQRRSLRAEALLAEAAEREPLPFEVRAVGEALRRYGAEEGAQGGPRPSRLQASEEQLLLLRSSVQVARAKHGDNALLRLRAAQSHLFRRALERWEGTRNVDAELGELGGSFPAVARRSGWLGEDHRLVLDEGERDVLFRLRWSELTGLAKQHPFRASLNDWRVYYRLLLEHPDVAPQHAARAQLRYVAALARLDPDFPASLANGVLAYRLGDYGQAANAFREHLDAHPDGPWRLRAQNHLAAAQRALSRPAD